jgi:predicted nucleic acid-binding protein
VTAVDTNILVYAHRQDAPRHDAARNCLQLLAGSSAAWAIPWPCIHEFLAVATNRRAFRDPSSMAEAIAEIEAWLESPSLRLIGETEVHWLFLKQVLLET